MPSIGDIANDIARALYEFRIPVAIVSGLAVLAIALIAHRRGWIAAARRHPGRSAAVLLLALAFGGPVTWYLASPIFIRTSLVEDLPTAPLPTTAPTVIAPPTITTPTGSPPASAAPLPTPTPFAPTTVASGEFEGTDEFHFGRGTAAIVEVGPGRYHLRLDDFSVRNGPDLFVVLSPDPDGYADDALEVGVLKATDGSFGYDLPDGIDPSRFRSALIWCKQFSHLFAVAAFEP